MSRRKQTQNPNENYPENAFFFFFYWQSLDHILLDYLSEEYVPIIVFLFFFNFGCAGSVVIACEFNGFMACGIIVR